MEAYTNQHYIPECYLKNFTLDGKGIFVYRKNLKNNIFPQSISNIACKKNFYDIDIKHLDKRHSDKCKYIEKEIFSRGFEPIYGSLLKKIIENSEKILTNKRKSEILTKIERDYFSELIALQYIRTPQFRDKYWNANKEIYSKRASIIQAFLSLEKPEFKDVKIDLGFDEKYSAAFHSNFILDENFRYMIQEQLEKKIWIYAYTDKSFYTSDNPILQKPHLPGQQNFVHGFGMRGVEIIFPISNNLILTIWDEEYFSELLQFNNTVMKIDDRRLREYNWYQYFFANSEVYNVNNDFSLIGLYKSMNEGIDYNSQSNKINIY